MSDVGVTRILERGMTMHSMGNYSETIVKMLGMKKRDLIVQLNGVGGLLGLGSKGDISIDEFIALLVHMWIKLDMELWVDVYFNHYCNHPSITPSMLYMFGFSQHIDADEEDLAHSFTRQFFQHMTFVVQPYVNTDTDALVPELAHKPNIVYHMSDNYIFPGRPTRYVVRERNCTEIDKLYLLMTTAYSCNFQHRFHEAWAFALSALDKIHLTEMVELKLSILCQVAVSSAELGLDPKITWMALEQAQFKYVHCHQSWEWLCACIQVLVAFGCFETEATVFAKAKTVIPCKSAWYETAVTHHLNGLVHQLEHTFMKTYALFHLSHSGGGARHRLTLADMQWVNLKLAELRTHAKELKVKGASDYYIGLAYMFMSMSRNMETLKRKYFHEFKMYMECAQSKLNECDVRHLMAKQLLLFVNHGVVDVEIISDPWRYKIYLTHTKCASEVWVKLALLNVDTGGKYEPLWEKLDTLAMITQAHHEYADYVVYQGYRQPLLSHFMECLEISSSSSNASASARTRLEEAKREDEKKEAIELFTESNDRTPWMQSGHVGGGGGSKLGVITSRLFVHENRYAEQAYATAVELSTMSLINPHEDENMSESLLADA